MISIIPFSYIPKIILSLLVFATAYHLAALAGLVPLDMVWGGKLQSRDELLVMELVSLLINLLLLLLVYVRTATASRFKSHVVLTVLCWVLVALFTFNTLGNLVAVNKWETILFTPVTAMLAYAFARLALNK